MAVKTYDPAQVIITVNGIIISGYADGTFVTVERDSDSWSKQIGADGDGTRSKSNDKSGKITISLMQSAESNEVLSALALLDEQTGGGAVPVLIKDNSGTSLHVAETAWIVKPATAEYGKEAGPREWVFDTDILISNIGKN